MKEEIDQKGNGASRSRKDKVNDFCKEENEENVTEVEKVERKKRYKELDELNPLR